MLIGTYETQTTFWTDFGIAERAGGSAAVRDTYSRAFAEWKDNIVYMTELTMVFNWKIWEHHETNEPLARVYNELWEKADAYCLDHFTGDDLTYFLETTD